MRRCTPDRRSRGLLFVTGSSGLGTAVVRAGALPRRTGAALIAGLLPKAAATSLPDTAQTAATGVCDAAFAGMVVCLLGHVRQAGSPT